MKKPKPKRRRTPAHKVNQRQRAAAIAALEKIVADPSSPPHVKMGASRALLNDGKPDSDAADPKSGEAAAAFIFLPSNGREAALGTKVYPSFEAAREAAEAGGKSGVFIHEAGDSAKHRAESAARLERRRARTEMAPAIPLLPAPEPDEL